MFRFLILCCVVADVFAVLAMGSKTEPIMPSLVNAPRSSPSENGKLSIAEAPMIRKLGKHQKQVNKSSSTPAQAPSYVVDNEHSSTEAANSPSEESGVLSEMNKIHLVKHHRNVDKSIAGGGVILGGLATIFLVAVVRYIRATRRKSIEPSA